MSLRSAAICSYGMTYYNYRIYVVLSLKIDRRWTIYLFFFDIVIKQGHSSKNNIENIENEVDNSLPRK